MSETSIKPKAVRLESCGEKFTRVLAGPPETITMRSGFVILQPGESVGKHSTGTNEELIVVFDGEGAMKIAGHPEIKLAPRVIAYCPPDTEHDVLNTGATPLQYLYAVANGKP